MIWVLLCIVPILLFYVRSFIGATLGFVSFYPLFHIMLYRNNKYRHLRFNNKMHVLSKYITSVVYMCLLIPGNDDHGVFFGCTSMASLLMVSHSFLTRSNHWVVVILSLLYQYVDCVHERCGTIYGLVRCISFVLDYMHAESMIGTNYYNVYILYIYSCVFGCNWLIQLYMLLTLEMSLTGVLWACCLVLLINKDIDTLCRIKQWVL